MVKRTESEFVAMLLLFTGRVTGEKRRAEDGTAC